MIELILTIAGLIGLWIGSDLMIRGALNISEHFKISRMFIGLTILAFLTDLPELFVTITGSYHTTQNIQTSGLIVGNLIGSSFGQLILMVGILSLFGTLIIKKRQLYRDGFVLLSSIILLILMGLDGNISHIEGIILIIFYILYLLALFREERLTEEKPRKALNSWWAIISLIAGLGILIYSSNLAVENAISLSKIWGVSQSLIGILIIGIGTSLPELAVSLSALKHKAGTMAIGNLIGSTIFDLIFVMGLGASISGLNLTKSLIFFDLPILLFFSIIFLFLFGKKMKLKRKGGFILIILYVLYALYKIGKII